MAAITTSAPAGAIPAAGYARPRFSWRVAAVLWAGIVVAFFAVVPFSLSKQGGLPPEMAALPLPQLLLRLAINVGIQAVVFCGLATLGLYLGTRVWLGLPWLTAWLHREPVPAGAALGRRFLLALIAGAVAGVAILAIDGLAFAPAVAAELSAQQISLSEQQVTTPVWQGLLASLYGGIAEESLLRLFVMTLLVWLGSRIGRTADGRPSAVVIWGAIFLAAILFGAGHLLSTAATGVPLSALVITRAIVLNGLGGVPFGWLYWRHGLETAMVAHWTADIVLYVAWPLIGGMAVA
jgi:membrane protease YdiL (CAAX protease family)